VFAAPPPAMAGAAAAALKANAKTTAFIETVNIISLLISMCETIAYKPASLRNR
jgi:hypothetical protein